ncbi:MAG: CRISPR-associated helicase Cas3' [Armatimonadota bacterium]
MLNVLHKGFSRMDSFALWGKTGDGGAYHPLAFHAVDAGFVARMFLQAAPSRHLAKRFAALFAVEESQVADLVAYLVALHDLGKATPGFQRKSPTLWERLQELGFQDNHPLHNAAAFRHDAESCGMLREYLPTQDVLRVDHPRPRDVWDALAFAVGSHHGTFLSSGEMAGYPSVTPTRPSGDEFWLSAREALIAEMQRIFLPGALPVLLKPDRLAALVALLNGMTILADWIASDTAAFPITAVMPVVDYQAIAHRQASSALERVGLLRCPLHQHAPDFRQLFPGISTPRPVQTALDAEALPHITPPVLAIIEAPMGEGKTEAALLLSRRLASAQDGGGFYFALPTQATSNQLFTRVLRFLDELATPEMPASVMLVHSRSELSTDLSSVLHPVTDWLDHTDDVRADAWFLPRKRRLLAPFAVGTIDQCLLGALQVRHGTLRLFGLAGKVVIIDEVHAYDAYMSTIIERLLEWLRAMDTSVILLSATLPSAMRASLMKAYGAETLPSITEAYPAITLVNAEGSVQVIAPPTLPVSKQVHVEYHARQAPEQVWHCLQEALADGGCAAWICNTVVEAQQTFRFLEEATSQLPEDDRPELLLYHARMLLQDRQRIEAAVLQQFGKEDNARRPFRAILVATQVVEQSLDIDFDLLVTALCPIDLLLQRCGRLHRHIRSRPSGVSSPRCLVLMPSLNEAGEPDFGLSAWVYSPFILMKTMVVLSGKDRVEIPGNIRPMIEAVYDDGIPEDAQIAPIGVPPQVVAAALVHHRSERMQAEDKARRYLLGKPDPRGRFYREHEVPALDDELLDAGLAAQTRLTEPSCRVIVLPAEHPLLQPGSELSRAERLADATARELLDCSVTIGHWALIEALESQPMYPAIEKTAALRGHHILPLGPQGYQWHTKRSVFRLCVSPVYGVTIEEVDE